MFLKTIEQERAEAEATVKGMDIVGKVRRLERSSWVYAWDDTDMDTTETLYRDSKGAYHLRIEECHDFMDGDQVWDISRKEAENWIRKNVRAAFTPRKYRRLQVCKQRKLQERNEVKVIAKSFIEAFAEYFGEEYKEVC